jgi:hypothetical protein
MALLGYIIFLSPIIVSFLGVRIALITTIGLITWLIRSRVYNATLPKKPQTKENYDQSKVSISKAQDTLLITSSKLDGIIQGDFFEVKGYTDDNYNRYYDGL